MEQLKREIMAGDNLTQREAYHIHEAALATSVLKSATVKRAIIEEMNMMIDIFYYLTSP